MRRARFLPLRKRVLAQMSLYRSWTITANVRRFKITSFDEESQLSVELYCRADRRARNLIRDQKQHVGAYNRVPRQRIRILARRRKGTHKYGGKIRTQPGPTSKSSRGPKKTILSNSYLFRRRNFP